MTVEVIKELRRRMNAQSKKLEDFLNRELENIKNQKEEESNNRKKKKKPQLETRKLQNEKLTDKGNIR